MTRWATQCHTRAIEFIALGFLLILLVIPQASHENMADSTQASTALLTEHLQYTPLVGTVHPNTRLKWLTP